MSSISLELDYDWSMCIEVHRHHLLLLWIFEINSTNSGLNSMRRATCAIYPKYHSKLCYIYTNIKFWAYELYHCNNKVVILAFGYYNSVTILVCKLNKCSTGKEFMQ